MVSKSAKLLYLPILFHMILDMSDHAGIVTDGSSSFQLSFFKYIAITIVIITVIVIVFATVIVIDLVFVPVLSLQVH